MQYTVQYTAQYTGQYTAQYKTCVRGGNFTSFQRSILYTAQYMAKKIAQYTVQFTAQYTVQYTAQYKTCVTDNFTSFQL